MDSREEELDSFKRNIDLSAYAASIGYVKDKGKSSASSVSMKHSNGDRIVISIKNGYWVYFSAHDSPENNNHGTIIDFVQKTDNANLGEVRVILRDYLKLPSTPIYSQHFKKPLKEREIDIPGIKSFLKRFKPVDSSNYLEGRGITQETLTNPLFKERILQGFDDAVIFPHWNSQGICGYEIKKEGFTSFAKKGIKSLWRSKIVDEVKTIIFTESIVEALSYYQLFIPEHVLFVTASGNWSETAESLIKALLSKHSKCCLVAAFNNDKGGEHHAGKLLELATVTGLTNYKKHFPEKKGHDWNDVLTGGH